MTLLVLDGAITLAWCLEREPKAAAALESIRRSGARVPGLWALEVANVLALAERRKLIRIDAVNEFLAALMSLRILVDHEDPAAAFGAILDVARAHRLTAYDAAYLELAMRHRLPLATLDKDLAKAAKKAGVQLFTG